MPELGTRNLLRGITSFVVFFGFGFFCLKQLLCCVIPSNETGNGFTGKLRIFGLCVLGIINKQGLGFV